VIDDPHKREQVYATLGVVVVLALIVGGVMAGIAYGVAHVAGLTGGSDPVPAAGPAAPATSAYAAASPSSAAPATPAASASASPSASTSPGARRHDRHGAIALTAHPRRVAQMGRISLDGRYGGGAGQVLQVQRREAGRWSSFPVTITVRGGTFHSWVASGRSGVNRFRVVDIRAGKASNPVAVTVR
jgi:hypothetical protein